MFFIKDLRINQQITSREVRLIGDEGQQLGVMTTQAAIDMARSKELDLVEVSPNAAPPVCKFIDYGKYRYRQTKVEHKHRAKQRANEVKEIRLTPRISDHDLETKAGQARKFLEKGDRVKINVMFRGRELAHMDIGHGRLKKFSEILQDISTLEKDVERQGNSLSLLLKPIK